jgi:hypothetical protein
MNFFGHAVVAEWFEGGPRYLLGSMLPDFASMSGTRLNPVTEPQVAAGVALHHRTDDAFHRAPSFLHLMAFARERLEAREVGWGTARAVAHVGSELLLDGVLLEHHHTAPYLDALDAAAALTRDQALGHAFRDSGAGFATLLQRLRDAGPPLAYQDPARVADFLERALSRRPRLRFQPGDKARVVDVLVALRPEVAQHAAPLLAHLRQHELLQPDSARATTAP